MKTLMRSLLVITLLPASVAAQVGRRPPPRLEQAPGRRAMLERQIIQRFVEQSGREIGLNGAAQGRLQQLLNESNARRRDLADRGMELRQRLVSAVRTDGTSDEEFRSILSDIDTLREQEHDLWRQDQQALARELTPRQRAMFTIRWLRFQETIRDVIDRRQEGRRGGGSGSPPDVGSGGGSVVSGRGSGSN